MLSYGIQRKMCATHTWELHPESTQNTFKGAMAWAEEKGFYVFRVVCWSSTDLLFPILRLIHSNNDFIGDGVLDPKAEDLKKGIE